MDFINKKRIGKAERTLKDQELCDKSFFHITFNDNSQISEKEYNWSDISIEKVVDFGNIKKVVKVCKHPLRHIKITHNDLETLVHLEKGDEIYQAYRSVLTHVDGVSKSEVIGKVVGIVRDGKVIEERFLDGRLNQVTGIRI